MLLGLLIVAAVMTFILVGFAFALLGANRTHREPLVERVDDLALVNEDDLDRLVEDATALGFTSVGTFSFVGNRDNHRSQNFVTAFISPDRRIQLELQLTRVIAGPPDMPTSTRVLNASAFSFGKNGRVVATGTASSFSPFPRPAFQSGRRVKGSLATVVKEHERHVAESGVDVEALDPSPEAFVARLKNLSSRVVESWCEHGLMRPDGDALKPTLKLVLRSFLLYAVLPGGCSQKAWRAFGVFVAVAIAGLSAVPSIWSLDAGMRVLAASGLFAGLTAFVVVAFEGPFTWVQLCSVLAGAFLVCGETSGVPWLAAFGAWMVLTPIVLRVRSRRQELLFESASARSSAGS